MKHFLKRATAMLLVAVMLVMMVPAGVISVGAATLPTELPSAFQVTSSNGKVTYNIPTADMTHDFYKAAKSHIDAHATPLAELQSGGLSFTTNGSTYTLASVYAYKPNSWSNTCGAMTGIFNYEVLENSMLKTKHVVLVAFRGTDMNSWKDVLTDLKAQDEDGYHHGFLYTARNHYNEMNKKVSYDLGDGSSISFTDYLKEMEAGNPDYTMIVTGHSLGGAVANIFVSHYLRNQAMVKNTNVVAYTYGTPCTCKAEIATAYEIDNVFNFINVYDWVPKVGYGGFEEGVLSNPAARASGYRQGTDLVYRSGEYVSGFSLKNHKIGKYADIKDQVNADIAETYPSTPPTSDNLDNMPGGVSSKKEKALSKILKLYEPMFRARKAGIESLLSGESLHTVVANTITSYLGIEIKSDTDKAIERMEAELVEVNKKLAKMEEELQNLQNSVDALSKSLEEATAVIIDEIEKANVEKEIKNFMVEYRRLAVRDNSPDSGDIYSAYDLWQTELKKGAATSQEQLKPYYDKLYRSSFDLVNLLYENLVKTDGTILRTQLLQNLLGDYYNYKETPDVADALLADIYATYIFAEHCLYTCTLQQMTWLMENEKENYLIDGKIEVLGGEYTSETDSVFHKAEDRHDEIACALAEFEAKTINADTFEGSILHYVSETGTTQQLPLNMEVRIERGDALYLFDIVTDLYEDSAKTSLNCYTDRGAFTYETSDETLATVTDNGVLLISDKAETDKTFTVTLKYFPDGEDKKTILDKDDRTQRGVEIHTWKFRIGKLFDWYGFGNEESPFVLSTTKDLEAFISKTQYTASTEYYFVLSNDIDMGGKTLSAVPVFKGTFDGHGHSIYGFKISTSSMTVGFFNKNEGTIKNLTLGSDAEDAGYFLATNYGYKSVYVYRSASEKERGTYYSGALVGENRGVIENCHVTNVYVGCDMVEIDNNSHMYCVLGGFAGCNIEGGEIRGCSIQNSRVTAYASAITNSGDDNHSYVGGFIGKLDKGNIVNCLASNNSISAKAEGNGYNAVPNGTFYDPWGGTTKNNYSYPRSVACGFVAEIKTGVVKDSFTHSNELTSLSIAENGDEYTDTSRQHKGAFFYDNDSGVISNCTEDLNAFVLNDSWIRDGDTLKLNDYVSASFQLEKLGICENQFFDPRVIEVRLIDAHGNISENIYPYFSYELTPLVDGDGYTLEVASYGDFCESIMLDVEDHIWESIVLEEATCAEAGKLLTICTRCSSATTQTIDATGDHTWNDGVVTALPTHTSAGVKTFTCTDCGETKTEAVPTTCPTFGAWSQHNSTQHVRTCACGVTEYASHTWNDGVETLAPTHTTEGVQTYTCTACGAIKTTPIKPIDGCTFGDWTKDNDSQHVRSCICGSKEYAAHREDDGKVTISPTATQNGEKTYSCLDCGAVLRVEQIPALEIEIPEDAPQIVVATKMATAGSIVKIPVSVKNNPGIWSLAFELKIDTNVFEFVDADTSASILDQVAMCQYDPATETYKFNACCRDLFNNVEDDGTLVVLSLRVKNDVPEGTYELALKQLEDEIMNVDEQLVEFYSVDGAVNVCKYRLGDVNGDGKVTNADVLRIFRYIYNSELYPLTVEIGDVNKDGKVTNADVLRIFRYIYNSELYPIE